jgi:transcriptional regulator with XRE-family HTH domain
MKDRLLKFLKEEKISSTRFAEEIGVQPSSISHILSGRNNPSYDFIVKTMKRYKKLNIEWLLTGTGEMFKSYKQSTLFDSNENQKDENTGFENKKSLTASENDDQGTEQNTHLSEIIHSQHKEIERIVIFFKDRTFIHYLPEN